LDSDECPNGDCETQDLLFFEEEVDESHLKGGAFGKIDLNTLDVGGETPAEEHEFDGHVKINPYVAFFSHILDLNCHAITNGKARLQTNRETLKR